MSETSADMGGSQARTADLFGKLLPDGIPLEFTRAFLLAHPGDEDLDIERGKRCPGVFGGSGPPDGTGYDGLMDLVAVDVGELSLGD